MKTDIHPQNYRLVIFKDASSDAQFLVGSTVETKEVAVWTDGKEYPLYMIEISSKSHPFYTGQDKALDTAGRAEKFKARVAKKSSL
jgi:large subunit ribosomal protein L31